MANARVISMAAQPSRAAFLSFEIGGILDERHVELGQQV